MLALDHSAKTRVALLLAGLALAPALALGADQERSYSLSLEVTYGLEESRKAYLEEIHRIVLAWIRSTGPRDAPVARGEADLHVLLVLDEVERKRGYPEASGQRDVFADMPQSATSPYVYSTRFEVRMIVQDPLGDGEDVVADRFTVYNQQRDSALLPDPRQRSWEDNLDFLVARIGRLLAKRDRKIRRYLQGHPRPPSQTTPAVADR